MKTILTFILTSFLFQTGDIEKLKEAFSNLELESTKENQQLYFDQFPEDFNSFKSTFGYQNEEYAPLYNDSYDYINKFFSLDKIPIDEKLKKSIEIGIHGKWQADAVNIFQHNLRPLLLSNVDLTYEILKKKENEEIGSLFYFFFQGVHPQYVEIPKEFNQIQNIDKSFYSLIIAGYEKAMNDSEH